MESKLAGATAFFAAAVVALATAITIAAMRQPRTSLSGWVRILVVVGAFFLLLAILLYVGARQTRPHLDFGLPDVEAHPVGPRFQAHFTAEPSAFSSTRGPTTGRVFASSTTGLVPQDATASARGPSRKNDDGVQPFFVYVPIINHDRPGRRAAEHPYGKLWFQTVSGDRIFSDLNARWAGTDPDFQLTRPRSLDSIPANGNHYDLDVAFKYLDDDHCYTFTDDNSSHEGLRKPDHLITDRPVLLRVVVAASGLGRLQGEFLITHEGAGTKPAIRRYHPFRKYTLRHPFRGEGDQLTHVTQTPAC